ncbi:MAG: hypothetical protein Q7R85_04360 [bacterium]|nr:hypothetical protein [bacterium]
MLATLYSKKVFASLLLCAGFVALLGFRYVASAAGTPENPLEQASGCAVPKVCPGKKALDAALDAQDAAELVFKDYMASGLSLRNAQAALDATGWTYRDDVAVGNGSKKLRNDIKQLQDRVASAKNELGLDKRRFDIADGAFQKALRNVKPISGGSGASECAGVEKIFSESITLEAAFEDTSIAMQNLSERHGALQQLRLNAQTATSELTAVQIADLAEAQAAYNEALEGYRSAEGARAKALEAVAEQEALDRAALLARQRAAQKATEQCVCEALDNLGAATATGESTAEARAGLKQLIGETKQVIVAERLATAQARVALGVAEREAAQSIGWKLLQGSLKGAGVVIRAIFGIPVMIAWTTKDIIAASVEENARIENVTNSGVAMTSMQVQAENVVGKIKLYWKDLLRAIDAEAQENICGTNPAGTPQASVKQLLDQLYGYVGQLEAYNQAYKITAILKFLSESKVNPETAQRMFEVMSYDGVTETYRVSIDRTWFERWGGVQGYFEFRTTAIPGGRKALRDDLDATDERIYRTLFVGSGIDLDGYIKQAYTTAEISCSEIFQCGQPMFYPVTYSPADYQTNPIIPDEVHPTFENGQLVILSTYDANGARITQGRGGYYRWKISGSDINLFDYLNSSLTYYRVASDYVFNPDDVRNGVNFGENLGGETLSGCNNETSGWYKDFPPNFPDFQKDACYPNDRFSQNTSMYANVSGALNRGGRVMAVICPEKLRADGNKECEYEKILCWEVGPSSGGSGKVCNAPTGGASGPVSVSGQSTGFFGSIGSAIKNAASAVGGFLGVASSPAAPKNIYNVNMNFTIPPGGFSDNASFKSRDITGKSGKVATVRSSTDDKGGICFDFIAQGTQKLLRFSDKTSGQPAGSYSSLQGTCIKQPAPGRTFQLQMRFDF